MLGSILLVQDDCDAGPLWANLLRQKGLNVVSAELEEIAAEQLLDQAFDLTVVNICTARARGIEICRKLREMFINPILLVATGRDEDFVLEAYAAGIDEYVSTSIDPRVFLAQVAVWLRHAWTVSAAALKSVEVNKVCLDTERRQVTIPTKPPQKLTNLEFRLLHLLMTHPDQTLETSRIIDRVWGYGDSDDSVLLKNVVYRLRRKIKPGPAQPIYIVTVPGVGYVFRRR